jgi:CheY-like chemotaxis protein
MTRLKVLLVDDNPAILAALEEILAKMKKIEKLEGGD